MAPPVPSKAESQRQIERRAWMWAAQGVQHAVIAKQLQVSIRTVRRWIKAEHARIDAEGLNDPALLRSLRSDGLEIMIATWAVRAKGQEERRDLNGNVVDKEIPPDPAALDRYLKLVAEFNKLNGLHKPREVLHKYRGVHGTPDVDPQADERPELRLVDMLD